MLSCCGCRIWDAGNSEVPPIVLRLGPQFGTGSRRGIGADLAVPVDIHQPLATRNAAAAAAAQPPPLQQQGGEEGQNHPKVIGIKWTADGCTLLAATSAPGDRYLYQWYWDLPPELRATSAAAEESPERSAGPAAAEEDAVVVVNGDEEEEEEDGRPGPSTGRAQAATGSRLHRELRLLNDSQASHAPEQGPSAAAAPPARRPQGAYAHLPPIREVARLAGHTKSVHCFTMSRGGSQAATASHDGTVRTWRRPRRSRGGSRGAGARWEAGLVLPVPPSPAAAELAAKKGRPAEAPEVLQVVWSADDRRLLVSTRCGMVYVFDARTGELEHRLTGHERSVVVVECHPLHPTLAFTAGYDGLICFWDLARGARVDVLDSTRMQPGGGVDGIPFAEGFFSRDGSSFVLGDVAGQLWFFGSGPADAMQRARYDQFFQCESEDLVRDPAGNVLLASTHTAPRCRRGLDLLCDYEFDPYDADYQAAFGERRLLSRPDRHLGPPEPTLAVYTVGLRANAVPLRLVC